MSRFESGTYIILPSVTKADGKGIAVGPVPRIYPPLDLTAKILYKERWVVNDAGNNTFTVTPGKGRPEVKNYKWIVKGDDDLYLSSTKPPNSFRIEPACDGVWVIGLPNKNALLTADVKAYPQLTFNPADGSEAQRFEFIRVDKSG